MRAGLPLTRRLTPVSAAPARIGSTLSGVLASGLLQVGRQQDFEAFWYFTIMAFSMSILVGTMAFFAFRSVRGLWKDRHRMVSLLVVGSVGFFCLFFLSLILITLIGLTHHATTPGNQPATIGGA